VTVFQSSWHQFLNTLASNFHKKLKFIVGRRNFTRPTLCCKRLCGSNVPYVKILKMSCRRRRSCPANNDKWLLQFKLQVWVILRKYRQLRISRRRTFFISYVLLMILNQMRRVAMKWSFLADVTEVDCSIHWRRICCILQTVREFTCMPWGCSWRTIVPKSSRTWSPSWPDYIILTKWPKLYNAQLSGFANVDWLQGSVVLVNWSINTLVAYDSFVFYEKFFHQHFKTVVGEYYHETRP
jgi:hypothetical protein